MPTRRLLSSTTGNPLIWFCSINRTARATDASGSTVMAPHVMTSCAFMHPLLALRMGRAERSGVEAVERGAIAQDDPPRRRQLDRGRVLQRRQRARDRLDGEAEI